MAAALALSPAPLATVDTQHAKPTIESAAVAAARSASAAAVGASGEVALSGSGASVALSIRAASATAASRTGLEHASVATLVGAGATSAKAMDGSTAVPPGDGQAQNDAPPTLRGAGTTHGRSNVSALLASAASAAAVATTNRSASEAPEMAPLTTTGALRDPAAAKPPSVAARSAGGDAVRPSPMAHAMSSGSPTARAQGASDGPFVLATGGAPSQPGAVRPATSLDPSPPAAQLPGVASQLVSVLSPLRTSASGSQTLTIVLHPVALGDVRATLTVSGDQVTVRLVASTTAGADALRAALPDLHSGLNQDGQRSNVLLGDPGGSSSGGAQGEGRAARDDGSSGAVGPVRSTDVAVADVSRAGHVPQRPATSRLLDVRL